MGNAGSIFDERHRVSSTISRALPAICFSLWALIKQSLDTAKRYPELFLANLFGARFSFNTTVEPSLFLGGADDLLLRDVVFVARLRHPRVHGALCIPDLLFRLWGTLSCFGAPVDLPTKEFRAPSW